MNQRQIQAWAAKLGKAARVIEEVAEVFGDEHAERIFADMARTDKAVKELRATVKALNTEPPSRGRGSHIKELPASLVARVQAVAPKLKADELLGLVQMFGMGAVEEIVRDKELEVAAGAKGLRVGYKSTDNRSGDAAPAPAMNTGRGVKEALSQRRMVKTTQDPFFGTQRLSVDTHVLTITFGQKGWVPAAKQAAVVDIGDAIMAMAEVLKLPPVLVDQMERYSGKEAAYDILKSTVEAQGGTVEFTKEMRAL